MQNTTQPFVRRTNILQDESLASLLFRLTALNSYESLSLLEGIVLEDPDIRSNFWDNFEYPRKFSTYERLIALTRLDIHSLYRCTLHRFAAILTPPPSSIAYFQLPTGITVPYFPIGYFKYQLRVLKAVQFCPKCLSESKYYRIRWAPVAISVCLKHRCLLIDRCQVCNQAVSLQAVMNSSCERCQASLIGIKTVSISDDEFGLLSQKIIQSWLMDLVMPEFARSQLPLEPLEVLYSFLNDLQYCIAQLRVGSIIYKLKDELPSNLTQQRLDQNIPTPYESFRFYTTACKALLNWPEGFHEFLFHYRNSRTVDYPSSHIPRGTNKKNRLIPGPLLGNLGYLYSRYIRHEWMYPQFKFVQEAFQAHIADNYWLNLSGHYVTLGKKHPELADRCEWVSIEDAADFLEISVETVEFLLGGDEVNYKYSIEDSAQLVSKKKVISLRANQARLLPLGRVVRKLGLNENIIKDLARAGLLTTEIRHYASNQLSFEEYTAESIVALLKNVTPHIKEISPQEISGDRVWLKLNGARRWPLIGHDVATIIRQLMLGNLRAYHLKDQPFRLGNLLFKIADIGALKIL